MLHDVALRLFSSLVLAVNRIKEQHKVSVRIPPDNEKSNLIRIEGDPQGVQLARKELLEMAARMVRKHGAFIRPPHVGRGGGHNQECEVALSHRCPLAIDIQSHSTPGRGGSVWLS